jgi:hypothetical protein
MILMQLAEGPADLGALVECTGLDPGTVSDFVSACEAVNFVQRHPRANLAAIPREPGTSDSAVRRGLSATMGQLRVLANAVLPGIREG